MDSEVAMGKISRRELPIGCHISDCNARRRVNYAMVTKTMSLKETPTRRRSREGGMR